MIISNWTAPGMESMKWSLELLEDGEICASGSIAYISAGLSRLEDVLVLPKFRGRGIGEMLVKILVFKCTALEIKNVLVEISNETKAFFEKLGFHVYDNNDLIKEITDGGCENCAHQRACRESQDTGPDRG